MDSLTLAIVAGIIGLLAAGAVAAVAVRSGRPVGLWAVVLPGLVLVVASAAAAVPASGRARSSQVFALGHLAYVIAALALPLLGVALLVAAVVRGARWPVWIVAVALLVPGPIAWYGTHVAPYRLHVERAEVEVHPGRSGSDAVRVGVISDLQTSHVGAYEQRAVTKVLALRPDIILVPGDLFQGSDAEFRRELAAYRRLLGRLHAPGGVFAVRGDVDRGDRLDQLVEGTDVQVLDYEIVVVRVGDRTVRIAGNGWRWASTDTFDLVTELQAGDPHDLRVLVAHRPDVVLRLPPSAKVDVTIAGHTHGGQIALPLLGPVLTSTRLSRRVAGGGLHEVAGNPIFVSSGIGMARLDAPQVRLLTRPAVGLVVLR